MARVYLDMDPGHDDAFALVLALKRFSVAGVTTVAGNTYVDNTFLNAQRILTEADASEVPVLRGSSSPLKRKLFVADYVHGKSGLDGHEFGPTRCNAVSGDAVDWLAARLAAEEQPVPLVATGPLTNVARLISKHPEAKAKISKIALMGGAFWVKGNVTPEAEFNIYVDPEAAAIVAGSGLPIWAVGLDVTHKALFPRDGVPRLARLGHGIGKVLSDLLIFYSKFYSSMWSAGGIPIHDAVAVYALENPDRFAWQKGRLEIDCTDRHRGKTSLTPEIGAEMSVSAAKDIDTEHFLAWVWQTLEMYR